MVKGVIMAKILIIILILFALFCAGYYYINKPTLTEEDFIAIDTSNEPGQYPLLSNEPFIISKKNINLQITQLALYNISARVLSKKNYSDGWAGKISPVDFALGWGDVSLLENLEHIKFKQIMRWYRYNYDATCPLTQDYIETHSSNHHIIPANPNISKAIKSIKKSDIIELEGYLVNVYGTYKGKKVWWNTSLSRYDKGDGSCEIIYVEKVKIGTKVYR